MNNKWILSSLLTIVSSATTLLQAKSIETEESRYKASVIPKSMSVQKKKKHFYDLLVPAIENVYLELENEYIKTQDLVKKDPQSTKIQKLMKTYAAKNPEDLLQRMKPHPISIALAQSAMESAWGTSRFFQEANNLFGVWSLNTNEPRVPAGQKRGNKTIYVKKYASIEDSVRDYYKILATGKVFEPFRVEKMKTNDPYKLVAKLDKYSERGAAYGKELASMIRYNKLTQYDK